jgi:hypothetical protein
MFLLHIVQRDEEALVIDCQQYCLENLTNRLYVPAEMELDASLSHASLVLRPE